MVSTLLPLPEIEFAGHDVHDEPASEYVLIGHAVQSVESSDPDGEDVPAGHVVHFEPASEYVLIAQVTQLLTSVEPGSDDFPAAQLKHVMLEVAAKVPEYVPSRHWIHTDPASEYVPAPQLMQSAEASDPLGDDLPATQFTQVLAAVAPVVARYLPTSQLAHATLPITVLYLPNTQAVHVPPFGPVYPALQPQLLDAVEPSGDWVKLGQFTQVLSIVAPVAAEYLPVAHFTQELSAVAPVVARYVPAPQLVHATLPVTLLYFPAAQSEHVPPSGPVYPMSQTKSLESERVRVLTGFDTHVLDAVAPVALEYLPVAQLKHHRERKDRLIILYLPAPQFKHELDAVAPVVPRYLPLPQLLHGALPVDDLNLPATQAEHAWP